MKTTKLVLAFALLTTAAWADPVAYTYSGKAFTEFTNGIADGCSKPNLNDCHVSGYVEFSAPLGSAGSEVLAWGWGPGNKDDFLPSLPHGIGINHVTPWAMFGLVPDASGAIVEWSVIVSDGETASTEVRSFNFGGTAEDHFRDGDTGDARSNFNDPGTWTLVVSPTAVPEPAGWMLMSVVLVGVSARLELKRRRTHR